MGKLKVKPQTTNANLHSPYGMGLLETSIGRDGWIDAITVAADDESISGSARIEVGATKGWDFAHEEPMVIQAPTDRPLVIETDGSQPLIHRRIDIPTADDPRARRLSVAANQITAVDWTPDAGVLAAWAVDDDAIKGLFTDDSWASLLAGVGARDVGGGGDDFDGTPAVEGPTRTALGDLWVIGDKHRLIVGDCTDPAVVERLMGGEEINCVFTSPPYDQQRTYEGNMALDWRALVSGALLLATQHCASDAQLFVNLGLIHRDGRVMRYWDNFIADMEDGGWPLFGWYVWDKLNGMPGDWNGRLAPAHEWVFHFCREALRPRKTVKTKHEGARVGRSQRERDGSLKSFTQAGVPIQPFKIPDSVVRLTQQRPDELVNGHPAPFPVALPETFLRAYAGDLWYDPFLGSGTSIIAAERAGRRCFGAEINPRYADLSLARAEAAGLTCTRVEP